MNEMPKLGQDDTPVVPKQLGKRPDVRATNASQPKSEPKEATKQTEAKDPNMEEEATDADKWTEVNRNPTRIERHTIGTSTNDLSIASMDSDEISRPGAFKDNTSSDSYYTLVALAIRAAQVCLKTL